MTIHWLSFWVGFAADFIATALFFWTYIAIADYRLKKILEDERNIK